MLRLCLPSNRELFLRKIAMHLFTRRALQVGTSKVAEES